MSYPREFFQLLPSQEDRAFTNRLIGAFTPSDEPLEWPPRWWKRLSGQGEPLPVLNPHTRETRAMINDVREVPTLPANYAHPVNRAPNPQEVLRRQGYLPQQRRGDYHPELSERIQRTISPTANDYEEVSPLGGAWGAVRGIIGNKERMGLHSPIRDEQPSEDAWSMFLGLPQRFGSFEVSPYRPSVSKDRNQVYLRLPGLWNGFEQPRSETADERITENGVQSLLAMLATKDRIVVNVDNIGTGSKPGLGFALGNLTLSKGQDEHGHFISLYDNWDLKVPGANTLIGRPFEIYDRLYYDPRTLRPIEGAR